VGRTLEDAEEERAGRRDVKAKLAPHAMRRRRMGASESESEPLLSGWVVGGSGDVAV
jgi:hypothetical protein